MQRKSWTVGLVALVCFGPFLVAIALYYGPWRDRLLPPLAGTRELLAAPVPLPPEWRADAAHPWQLIYARTGACELPCAHDLGRLLQVQIALNADRELVQRVVWHEGMLPDLKDAELRTFSLESAAGQAILASLGSSSLASGRVLVADPRGSVILSYPADVEQKELLRDLKRLLRGSH